MFLKHSCEKTCKRIAFPESEHNNLVLSLSRMKSRASLYQKSHIQAYICREKKMLLYYLDNTHTVKWVTNWEPFFEQVTRWDANYKTNHDHLEFVVSNEAEVPTFRSSYNLVYKLQAIFKPDYQDSESKQSTSFDVKSVNGVNFYRSIQLCAWRNNLTKNKKCYNICTKFYVNAVQLAWLQAA